MLATAPGHHLGRATAPIPFSGLRGEHNLLLDEEHCCRDQVIEYCSGRGMEKLSFRTTSLPTLVQLAWANMGITLLPRIAVPAETLRSGLMTRPIARPAPYRTIALAWRRQSALSEAMRKIAETVRSAIRDRRMTEGYAVSGTNGGRAKQRHAGPGASGAEFCRSPVLRAIGSLMAGRSNDRTRSSYRVRNQLGMTAFEGF